jgi:hypothetical protein
MKDSQNDEPKKSTRKPGETLKDKIHRHLNDKNDIITEDDLRDVLIDKMTPEKKSSTPEEK